VANGEPSEYRNESSLAPLKGIIRFLGSRLAFAIDHRIDLAVARIAGPRKSERIIVVFAPPFSFSSFLSLFFDATCDAIRD